MPKLRINMAIQNEILRLKKLGLNKSKVARTLKVNRETVRKYWSQLEAAPLADAPRWVEDLDWKKIRHDLDKKVPIKILYQELKDEHALPSYQAFCQYLRAHCTSTLSTEVVIKIERTPGGSIEVDYSGDGHPVLSPSTGAIFDAQLFVGSLSYSGYMYAEFTKTQQLEDFIGSHNNMFTYFGGTAKYIIPDNCKTAVSKADKYDPKINPTYHDMCCHYGIAVDPADGYSPKHKPNVENAVGIIQRDFLARIRNKTYTSLYELNRDLRAWLKEKNSDVMLKRGHSRKYFFERERSLLGPLPADPYEIKTFKKAKVHPDCHIQHLRNFYSVPFQYVGREVEVKYNSKIVHVFYEGSRIASHAAMRGHAHYSTVAEHYPEKKVVDINYHLMSARNKARGIGSNMESLVERLIRMDRFPLKTLRKVQGVLGLAEVFSAEALDAGAKLCLDFDKLTYRSLKSFTKYYRPEKEKTHVPVRDQNFICLQGGKNE